MTTINTTFGAGDATGNYDPLINLGGGVKLDGAYFNNNTFLEAHSGSLPSDNSYTYTFSFWYKIDVNASQEILLRPVLTVQDCLCDLFGLEVYIEKDEGGWYNLVVNARSSDQSQSASFREEVIPTHDSTWHNVVIYQRSWDGSGSTQRLYIDGVAKTITELSEFTRDMPFQFNNQWRVGGGINRGIDRFEGCLDEYYFTFDYLDPAVPSNLAKLINPDTKYPVALGAQGERPTGNAATIYLKDEGEDFYINYGNLGIPFEVFGELPKCTDIYPDDDVNPPIPPIDPVCDGPEIVDGETWDGVLNGVYLDGTSHIYMDIYDYPDDSPVNLADNANPIANDGPYVSDPNAPWVSKEKFWMTLSCWVLIDENTSEVSVIDLDSDGIADWPYPNVWINFLTNWSWFLQLSSFWERDDCCGELCWKEVWSVYFQYQCRGPSEDSWSTPYGEIGYCRLPVETLRDGRWHHIFFMAGCNGDSRPGWEGVWDAGGIWFDGVQVLDPDVAGDFWTDGYTDGFYDPPHTDLIFNEYTDVGILSSSWPQGLTSETGTVGAFDKYYLSFDKFTDIPDPDNHINNFRDPATGLPKDLGLCGQKPTGIQPWIFLNEPGGEFFAQNKGNATRDIRVQHPPSFEYTTNEVSYVANLTSPGRVGKPMDLEGVYFNGIDTKLLLGTMFGALSGVPPDTKKLFFSFWFNAHGSSMQGEIFSCVSGIYDDEGEPLIYIRAGTKLTVYASKSGGNDRVEGVSTADLPTDTDWHHLLIDINSHTGWLTVYLDDNPFPMNTTISGTSFDMAFGTYNHVFSRAPWRGGTARLRGSLAYFYVNISENIDITNEANRRRFINENNLPVFLGYKGEIPTGTEPYYYFGRPGWQFKNEMTGKRVWFGGPRNEHAGYFRWFGNPGTSTNRTRLNGVVVGPTSGITEVLNGQVPTSERGPINWFNIQFFFRTSGTFKNTTIFVHHNAGSYGDYTIALWVDHDHRIKLTMYGDLDWQQYTAGYDGEWLETYCDGNWHHLDIACWTRNNRINTFGGIPHVCSGWIYIDRWTRYNPTVKDGGFYGGQCWDILDDGNPNPQPFNLVLNKSNFSLFPVEYNNFPGVFSGCISDVYLMFDSIPDDHTTSDTDAADYSGGIEVKVYNEYMNNEPAYLGDNGELPLRYHTLDPNPFAWWYLDGQGAGIANNKGNSPNAITLQGSTAGTNCVAWTSDEVVNQENCSYRDFSEYTAGSQLWNYVDWEPYIGYYWAGYVGDPLEYVRITEWADEVGTPVVTTDATSSGGQKLVFSVVGNADHYSAAPAGFIPTNFNRDDQEIIYHGIYKDYGTEVDFKDRFHNCGFVRGSSTETQFSAYVATIRTGGVFSIIRYRSRDQYDGAVTSSYTVPDLTDGDEYWIRLRAEGTQISGEISKSDITGLQPNFQVTASNSYYSSGVPGLIVVAPDGLTRTFEYHDVTICYDLDQGSTSPVHDLDYTCFGDYGTGTDLWTQDWVPEYSGSAELADDHATWTTSVDGTSTCGYKACLAVDGTAVEQHALTTWRPDIDDYYAADQEILWEGTYHSSGVAGEATDILQNAGFVRGRTTGTTDFECYVATLRYDGDLQIWYYKTGELSYTAISTRHPFTISEGDRYWLRLKAEGDTISAQVSLTNLNNTIPSWDLQVTDTTIDTGRVGIAGSAGGTGQPGTTQTFCYHQFAFSYTGGHAQFELTHVNEQATVSSWVIVEGVGGGNVIADDVLAEGVTGDVIVEGLAPTSNTINETGSPGSVIIEGEIATSSITTPDVYLTGVTGDVIIVGFAGTTEQTTPNISVTGEEGAVRIVGEVATTLINIDSSVTTSVVGDIIFEGMVHTVNVTGGVDVNETQTAFGSIDYTGMAGSTGIITPGQYFGDPLSDCGWDLYNPQARTS